MNKYFFSHSGAVPQRLHYFPDPLLGPTDSSVVHYFSWSRPKIFFPCFDATPSLLRDLMSGRSLLALVGSRTTSRGDTVSLFILFPVLQNNYCGLNFGSVTDQFGRVLQPGLGSRFYKETDKPAISASPQLSTKVARVRKKIAKV